MTSAPEHSPHEAWLPTGQVAAAALIPGATSGRSVGNLIRMGCRSADGRRVRLRGVEINGRAFTKRSWVDEFLNELAAAAPADPPAPVQVNPETPAAKEKRLDAEQAELEELLGPLA